MPLQNRVRPDGEITNEPWRGLMMGNRGGRIHDPETKTLSNRKWASRRWIICVTDFKNRQRQVMGKSYTELFFTDEAAALACGHRPCFECRRDAANQFAELWDKAVGKLTGSRADRMDSILHVERKIAPQCLSKEQQEQLPDGAFVQSARDFFVMKNSRLWKWTGDGYSSADVTKTNMRLLTPPSILKVLESGCQPLWHPSIA